MLFLRKDAGVLMSFPNESEDAFPQVAQNLDVPPLVYGQDLPPENKAMQIGLPTNGTPRKHRLLIGLQTAGRLVGMILLALYSFFSFKGTVTTPTTDIHATQVSLANETSTVNAGNATTVALETVVSQMKPQAIYQMYTQGKPLFQDTLTDFGNTYFYDPDTMKPYPDCAFQKDGMHITESDVGYWTPCNNSAFPDLMNFSFQYNFSILKGDSAGLRFRAINYQAYYFDVDTSGNYKFIYYPKVMDGTTSQTIQSGVRKLMHKGYGAKNQLTLIAIGDLFYFYLNQQFLTMAADQTLTMGELSLLVDSETAPTEAVFSQAVAWNIAGMAP